MVHASSHQGPERIPSRSRFTDNAHYSQSPSSLLQAIKCYDSRIQWKETGTLYYVHADEKSFLAAKEDSDLEVFLCIMINQYKQLINRHNLREYTGFEFHQVWNLAPASPSLNQCPRTSALI